MPFRTIHTYRHLVEVATEYACSVMDTVLRPVYILAVLSDVHTRASQYGLALFVLFPESHWKPLNSLLEVCQTLPAAPSFSSEILLS